ncbi:MAG: hypothetical protein NC313_16295 [Butyrivibrio sp.]|nr:hypothetical protein [Butyrivibrio sp.]
MIISRNLDAMNLNRIVNSNISMHAKSSEKVSSGYKVNLAVDNPVGLAMSETMRRQIRGLMQGTNNTKDGVAFVQIADGAMSEVHDMLQRMNELSLKSADGLCTASDRAALNAEFDQLRTEIDRINNNTSFNTLPVFEEHEPSYYQICGNRRWDDNQLHTITESENELNIHLPDGYVPKDYTITVPAGTYTTQELIDEIDNALHKMSPPNPGFVFEYTSDGYCNLNFESAEGKPTMIDFIDGSLSYLIYDFERGGSPVTLLGTTGFGFNQNGTPSTLTIYKNLNDTLGFYAESAEGSPYISITLDTTPGSKAYTCDELIEEINSKLDEVSATIPIAANIRASSYEVDGREFIQITGGDTVNIIGFRGNMFRYELNTSPNAPVYSSVFYDNAIYSNSTKYPASITGNYQRYPMVISSGNNILKFKVDGDKEYTVEFPLNSDGTARNYTVSEIASIINDKLGTNAGVTASGSTYLTLRNKLTGTKSTLDFASYFGENQVYKNTYETLFWTTSGNPSIQKGRFASLTGAPVLNGQISLAADAYLSFNVNGNPYTISNIGGTYANLGALIATLNNAIQTMDIKDKIQFNPNNNPIQIISISPDVDNIRITDKNATYIQLFTGDVEVPNGSFSSSPGSSTAPQGETVGTIKSATATASSCQSNIEINDNNNQLTISLTHNYNTESKPITLPNGSYTPAALATEIRNSLGADAGNITISGTDSKIELEYTPSNPAIGDTWSIDLSGSALNAVFGTKKVHAEHTSIDALPAKLISYADTTNSITIDGSNNTLTLNLDIDGSISSQTITVNPGTYTRQGLANELNSAINFATVSVDPSGTKLQFTAPIGLFSGSGSFYDEIICKGKGYENSPSNGYYNYNPDTRIIGRTDLTKEPVKIEKDINDKITFDFTYPGSDGSAKHLEMTVTLPPGEYRDGIALFGDNAHPNQALINDIKKQIEEYDQKDAYYDEIQRLFGEDGSFDLNFLIGGYKTNAANNVDESSLQITITPRKGADVPDPDDGQYILDGVRGSATPFVFYKTTSLPTASYIVGTKNVTDGITIETGKNVLILYSNDVPYQYTFPENTYYTADELLDWLNDKFKNGDDFGNPIPLRASLDENGAVKISYTIYGANKITNVSGSARSTIFFEEEGRDSREPLILQVGAEQRSTIELPRISVSSCSLGINSLTISQIKYADKAIERIKEAIHKLNARRSTYGAMQNRLEHTINNNENITENVQDTESGIRDADIATEMIRYSNLSVLLKAGQTMIAQSNQRIEKLLTILQ